MGLVCGYGRGKEAGARKYPLPGVQEKLLAFLVECRYADQDGPISDVIHLADDPVSRMT